MGDWSAGAYERIGGAGAMGRPGSLGARALPALNRQR